MPTVTRNWVARVLLAEEGLPPPCLPPLTTPLFGLVRKRARSKNCASERDLHDGGSFRAEHPRQRDLSAFPGSKFFSYFRPDFHTENTAGDPAHARSRGVPKENSIPVTVFFLTNFSNFSGDPIAERNWVTGLFPRHERPAGARSNTTTSTLTRN